MNRFFEVRVFQRQSDVWSAPVQLFSVRGVRCEPVQPCRSHDLHGLRGTCGCRGSRSSNSRIQSGISITTEAWTTDVSPHSGAGAILVGFAKFAKLWLPLQLSGEPNAQFK